MVFSSSKHTSQDLLFLLPLSLFVFLFRLGSGSLASWDEAIYASVAKEIVLSGDWLRLTLNGDLWFDKPPLVFWITALFYKIFGIHEFSARLFSALCGAGTVLVTYFLGRQLLNRWTGFIGALILLTSAHFIRFSRFGMMDAPLTFFMTLAFYFFWLGQNKNRYLIFSGVSIGLAVMTKGFAAFLVFPVIWVYCLSARRLEILGRSSYWVGVIVAVLIALPWHLYELWAHEAFFMKDVVIRHLFDRTTTVLDGHAGNLYFYLRVLVNKFHPWILIGIFSAPYFLFKAIKDREEEFIFLSVWMFLIFAIITLVRTKLAWYLLPVYPALSLSAAYFVAKIFQENSAWVAKSVFVMILGLHVFYSHIFNHDYSRDIKGIAPAVLSRTAPAQSIYLYSYHESPAVSFYLGKKSLYLDSKEEFLKKASESHFNCLIHENDFQAIGPSVLQRYGLTSQASFEKLHLISKQS